MKFTKMKFYALMLILIAFASAASLYLFGDFIVESGMPYKDVFFTMMQVTAICSLLGGITFGLIDHYWVKIFGRDLDSYDDEK